MLPTIKIGDADVTRLIIGGNPFSGNSHWDAQTDWEMRGYFSTARIRETIKRAADCGVNTVQLRADMHIMRILYEYRMEVGDIQWIAQTASEMLNYTGHINQLLQYKPIAIYHHGSITDALFKEGKIDELYKRIAIIKDKGIPVGLGTHIPQVIEYAEEHGWGVDFYMACVYNISRADRVSSAITGKSNSDEPFFEEDIPVMYKTIRQTPKPCLAFKILGAGRRCDGQDMVKRCFEEAFVNIKPTDAVVVGVFPKEIDQVGLNCRYTAEAIEKANAR